MADSVTNVQIEDVLASIRKLVSEEVRAQGGVAGTLNLNAGSARPQVSEPPAATPGQDRARPAQDDTLVLTPALRVSVEQPLAAQPQRRKFTTPPIPTPPFSSAENTPDDPALTAAGEGAPDPDEAGFVEVEDHVALDAELISIVKRATSFAEAPEDPAEEDDPFAAAPDDAMTPYARASELEPEQAAVRPDTGGAQDLGQDVQQDRLQAAEPSHDEDDLATEGAAATGPADQDASDTEALVPGFLRRNGITSLEDRIAALGSAMDPQDEWEPEADDVDDALPEQASSFLPWSDMEDAVSADEFVMGSPDEQSSGLTLSTRTDRVSAVPRKSGSDAPAQPGAPVAGTAAADDTFGAPDQEDAQDDEAIAIAFARDETDDETVLTEPDSDETWQIPDAPHAAMYQDRTPAEPVGEPDAPAMEATGPAPDESFATDGTEDEGEDWDDIVRFPAAGPDLAMEDTDDALEEPEPEDALTQGAGPAPVQDERLALDDGAYLDEEILRDLVSEIVRQELQGALGERITRNVRKLVRREIHRALAAQDRL
ncbi:hypothetical protein ACRARG_16005 [Pseudooceanicola sp. C21-150M6]|uniref:hypothetical protein n=1 Tax=Pseudooceanicola sp. C21-150M6 TaxID=3434355 RepID=UPI003D7F8E19